MYFRRKAILFIHGFVGGSYDFGMLPNILEVNRWFDVFSFTLPGHDKSIVKDVKYEDWINEGIRQIEFIKDNGYKEIYVIGHSMGGVIAAYLASIYPQVKRLVLVAPAFQYLHFANGKVDIKSINDSIKEIGNIFKGENTEKVISRIIKTPISTIIEFAKLVNTYQTCVNGIKCPILIIHGVNDSVVPEEAVKYVHDNVKSRSNHLVNIEGVSHDCFTQEKNYLVNGVIIQFLKKRIRNTKDVTEY